MKKRIIGLGTVDIGLLDAIKVAQVLFSKKISPGKYQKEFEQLVSDKQDLRYGTFVNSGQSALHLSFEAIKLLRPTIKNVICPATTYISTLHAVWNAGLKVKLVDIDDSLNIDWSKIKGDHNKDILCPVNLMGLSAVNTRDKYKQMLALVRKGFYIVEDNCESVFSPDTGYGDFICLSFYAAHQITTGSGGMVCCRDQNHDDLIKSLCNHGRVDSSVLYSADRNEHFDKSKKFIFDKVGFSYKVSDFTAMLGLTQLKKADRILKKKKQNAEYLIGKIGGFCFDNLAFPTSKDNFFMNLPIICKTPKIKSLLIEHLNNYQIETRDLMPILNQPVLEKMNSRYYNNASKFPVAYKLLDTGFYIGCHQGLNKLDLDYIVKVFQEFLNESVFNFAGD